MYYLLIKYVNMIFDKNYYNNYEILSYDHFNINNRKLISFSNFYVSIKLNILY